MAAARIPHGKRTEFRRRKIAGLRWATGFLFLLLLYWWVMTNFVIRDFWDPQFANKRESLQARMREYPNHPLWLILGDSRVRNGVRPGMLLDRMRGDGAPLIYNFGMGGANLYRESICLSRLIASGLKPQRVGIEIVGAAMSRELFPFADEPKLFVRARRNELDELCSYSADPARTRRLWWESRVNPFFKDGMKVPGQTLAWRLIPIPMPWRVDKKNLLDKWGWHPEPPAPIPPETYRKSFEIAKSQFASAFQDFKISPINDRVMRQILNLCGNSGIDVFMLRMPEGIDFQAFYTPQANGVMDSYLEKIKTEYGVSMIDARGWFPEKEAYTDGHHLNATGAAAFTLRFGGELFRSAKPQAARKDRNPLLFQQAVHPKASHSE